MIIADYQRPSQNLLIWKSWLGAGRCHEGRPRPPPPSRSFIGHLSEGLPQPIRWWWCSPFINEEKEVREVTKSLPEVMPHAAC